MKLDALKEQLNNKSLSLNKKAALLIEACAEQTIAADALQPLIQEHISAKGPCLLALALAQDKLNPNAIHFILKHNLGSDLQSFTPGDSNNTLFSTSINKWRAAFKDTSSSTLPERTLFIATMDVLLAHLFMRKKSLSYFESLAIQDVYPPGYYNTLGAKLYHYYNFNDRVIPENLIIWCNERSKDSITSPFSKDDIEQLKSVAEARLRNLSPQKATPSDSKEEASSMVTALGESLTAVISSKESQATQDDEQTNTVPASPPARHSKG